MLLSGSIVLVVGLIDDFGALTPTQKLFGQALAALVLIRSGTYIKLEFLPIYIAIPVTVLWLLAVTNALNIIDILDGLAAGVATIAAVTIAIANSMAGRGSVAFLSIVLAGACLGFLQAQLSSCAYLSGRYRQPLHRLYACRVVHERGIYALQPACRNQSGADSGNTALRSGFCHVHSLAAWNSNDQR